jgi:hypothetical protein
LVTSVVVSLVTPAIPQSWAWASDWRFVFPTALLLTAVTAAASLQLRSRTDAATWPTAEPNNAVAVGVPPEFPDNLARWTYQEAWKRPLRVFAHVDSPAPIPAENQTRFPSTQNHCDAQRFLIRWRSLNPNATVAAVLLDAVDNEVAREIGAAGWMDIDGCRTPAFQFHDTTDESNLLDVVVEIQRWEPRP